MKVNKRGVELLSIDYRDKNHKAICKCPICGTTFKMYASQLWAGVEMD